MAIRSLNQALSPVRRSSFLLLPVALVTHATGASQDFAVGSAPSPSYYLTPQYDSLSATEWVATKVDSGLDVFAAEALGERLGKRLAELGERLQQSPDNSGRVGALLSAGFTASGWGRRENEVRSGPRLRLFESAGPPGTAIDREAFLAAFQSLVAAHERIDKAEFKIVRVEAGTDHEPTHARTVVRFDLVGPADEANAGTVQQRGEWVLDWRRTSGAEWLVDHWRAGKKTRVQAQGKLFVDVSKWALGANPSYAAQLLPSVDDWRTRLDGAVGVDLYGHHGVSTGDIDGDRDDDFYVSQPSGLPNRLFRNDGELTFTDITVSSGVGVLDSTSMALFADTDNDGDQDLIVVAATAPLLFLNDGTGRFRNSPGAFALQSEAQGQLTAAALADYDLDGDLDLYVCAYRFHGGTGVRHAPTPYHDANNGPTNYLLRNRGDGTFEDVTRAAGLHANNSRFSFAASWEDYDGDSYPDLYVANDFGRNNLYRNNGDGTFADVAPQLGVEDVGAGMSATWFDYDRDGSLDLYVGNMWSAAGLRLSNLNLFRSASLESERDLYRRHAKGNTLFRGQPDGTFVDTTLEAGVELGRWAWSSGALDFDNDGCEDLYIANGYVTNSRTQDL